MYETIRLFMKHLKAFEMIMGMYNTEYKFYWIIPFDDRLTESIIEKILDERRLCLPKEFY